MTINKHVAAVNLQRLTKEEDGEIIRISVNRAYSYALTHVGVTELPSTLQDAIEELAGHFYAIALAPGVASTDLPGFKMSYDKKIPDHIIMQLDAHKATTTGDAGKKRARGVYRWYARNSEES